MAFLHSSIKGPGIGKLQKLFFFWESPVRILIFYREIRRMKTASREL